MHRQRAMPFPGRLDDYIAEDSAAPVIDVFIDDLNGSGRASKPNPMTGADRPADRHNYP